MHLAMYEVEYGKDTVMLNHYAQYILKNIEFRSIVSSLYIAYYLKRNKLDKAYEWYKRDSSNEYMLSRVTNAELLNRMGYYEESNAIAKNDLQNISSMEFYDVEVMRLFKIASSNYINLGNPDSAYLLQCRYIELKEAYDSINSQDWKERFKVEYEVEKKTAEIIIQDEKIKQLNIIVVNVVIFFSAIIVAYLLYNKKRRGYYKNIVAQNQSYLQQQEYYIKEIVELEKSNKDNQGMALLSRQSNEAESQNSISEATMSAIFKKILKALDEDKIWRDRNLSRENFAERIGVNRTYLTKTISQKMGMSYSQFINNKRVEEAIKLLSDPKMESLSMNDVASESGFASMTTFYTVFKKYKGISPLNYKKMAGKLYGRNREEEE